MIKSNWCLNKQISFLAKASNLNKDITSTTLLTLFGRAGGMLVPFIIARYFGANIETDSFFLAYSIVFYIANIFAPSLEKLIVPFINEKQKLNQTPNHFVSNVGWSVTIILVIISSLSIFIIYQISPLISNNEQLVKKTISYFLLISPILFIVCWSSLFSGVLNAYKFFSIPAISPVIRFIFVLFSIVIFHRSLGIFSVILGILLGESIRLIFLFLKLKKAILYKIYKYYNNDEVKNYFKVASYQIYVSFIYGLLTVIDRVIASYLGEGNITLYHYVEKIYFIPYTLFTIGVVPVLLTYWGESYQKDNNNQRVISSLKITLIKFSFIIIPVITFLIIIKENIIQILLGGDTLSSQQIRTAESTFIFLIFGLLPQILTLIQTNVLIIFKKTNYLFYTSFFVLLIKPFLSIILIDKLNLQGLAIANTITHLFVFFLFVYFINKTEFSAIK